MLEPCFYIRMIVSTIIVQNQMKIAFPRSVAINLAQELQKLLVAMKRITGTNHGTFKDIERCKKASSPVTFVIMRHGSTSPFFHRQPRLGSIQRLDLRLFIDTQHKGFIRRIQIQTHNVRQFFNKPFVLGQLERLSSMGLQPMGIPNSCNAGVAYAQFFGHHASTPVSRANRGRLESRLHNCLHFLGGQTLRARTMGSIFRQSQKPLFEESLSPKQNRWTRRLQLFGNGVVGSSVGCTQTNLGSQNYSLRRGSSPDPSLKRFPLLHCHRQSISWFPHDTNCSTINQNCKDITETLH